MSGAEGYTHSAAPEEITAPAGSSTVAPPATTIDGLFGKHYGQATGPDGSTCRIEFVPKPFIPAHPILTALNTLGFIAGGTWEPGGPFGSLAIAGPLAGLKAIPSICTTDWKSTASWLADTASTCCSGLTSNLGSIAASDAAPWLLFGAAAGLSAWAYKSYYSQDDKQSDPVESTDKSDAETERTSKRGKAVRGVADSLNRGASAHKILPSRVALY